MKEHPIVIKVLALCTALAGATTAGFHFLRMLGRLLIEAIHHMERMEGRIDENAAEIVTLQDDLRQKNDEIVELRGEIKRLTDQNDGQQAQINILRDQLATATRERDEALERLRRHEAGD